MIPCKDRKQAQFLTGAPNYEKEIQMKEYRVLHKIPGESTECMTVFAKSNELAISHAEFVLSLKSDSPLHMVISCSQVADEFTPTGE